MNQFLHIPRAAGTDRRSDSPLEERRIGMGEMQVVSGQCVLKTLLGSCVGLAIHDRRAGVGGLAHVVLPKSAGNLTSPGKFADTALPELLRLIEQLGGKTRNFVAKLAGGASMFSAAGANAIGDQNILAIEEGLKALKIPVLGRHCGGKQGRRMAFFVETGRVTIEVLGCPPVEL